MFTGIIEEVGRIVSLTEKERSVSITIEANRITQDMHTGDSINTNGVCLTVTSFGATTFTVDAVAETLRRTTLGSMKPGLRVNLERALPANGRFGGHIVSGHIDGAGTIINIRKEGASHIITVQAGPSLMKYIVPKGSVALDGISLTIADTGTEHFSVAVIPFTGSETTLLKQTKGSQVNVECDILAKYVERLVNPEVEPVKKHSLNMDYLTEHGFID